MKFEYQESAEDKECVAFIDGDGDLWIRAESGDFDEIQSVVLFSRYASVNASVDSIEHVLAGGNVIRKFYPGDKITITF